MRMTDIIAKKRDGGRLTLEEIRFVVRGTADGSLPDYQLSALLMAIFLRGMDEEETAALTLEMAASGQVADLSAIPGVKVDKHSTGGVGDLTTLVALPLAAACGVKVPKMSGRALGHTGGTLDKLWSIPGCTTELSMERFIAQVQRIGCALVGQTGDFAPVDKRLYALRDVTATVESLPLIVSSILSKKLAAGCDAMVLDVKTGDGAFMRTLAGSKRLAEEMVKIAGLAGKRAVALVTDMDQPLGSCIGNALEVREAAEILRGLRRGRARELCLAVAGCMVELGLGLGAEPARRLAEEALDSGAGADKLRQLIQAQGGDARVVDQPERLPSAPETLDVEAGEQGYVGRLDCRALGLAVRELGAGRERAEDAVDPAVGVELFVEKGSRVQKGQALARIHAKDLEQAKTCAQALRAAVHVQQEAPEPSPLVLARIG